MNVVETCCCPNNGLYYFINYLSKTNVIITTRFTNVYAKKLQTKT